MNTIQTVTIQGHKLTLASIEHLNNGRKITRYSVSCDGLMLYSTPSINKALAFYTKRMTALNAIQ